MSGETTVTLVGNLTGDPELRTTGGGATVVNFTVASTPRSYDRNSGQWVDGQALFLRCSAWRDLGQHVAQSLSKGMRVIVQGSSSSVPIRRRTGRTARSLRCRSMRSARA